MVSRLIDFASVVLKLLMFKVCVIIRILKLEFFNFSDTERVNIGFKDCSKISFTVGQYCIEARELTGFCTIRAFKERYLQSINSSEAFLLLNYFILLICLKKLFFRSISSVIVVFNNRNFMTCEKHYYFSEISNMKNNYLFT